MSDETLNLNSSLIAYDDSVVSSNPSRKVEWKRNISGLSVNNVQKALYTLSAGENKTIFSGTRSTSINSTTDFDIELMGSSTYRFTWAGAGAAPVFRTDRLLTPDNHEFTIVVNANTTITVTSDTSGEFDDVVVGDTVFIPGTSTNDTAGPFNAINEGVWEVLATSTSSLVLARSYGSTFSAINEVVTLTDDSQFIAYSASGVQISDKVNISAGFSSVFNGTYEIVSVTPEWFEISSTKSLPANDSGVPTSSGMVFYTNAKRYLKIESNQDCIVRLNGDESSNCKIIPWLSGDETLVGELSLSGDVWALEIVNSSTSPAKVTVISAE